MEPATLEMSEVQRRKFLHTAGQGAMFLLAANFPTSRPGLLGAEQLDLVAGDLDRLRRTDGLRGASGVAVEAAWHAQRLLTQLKTTPAADPLRRRLAMLTGDAAGLASHTAFYLGETGPALAWARVIESAGLQAGAPDLIGWGVNKQARALSTDGNYDQALGVLQRAPKDGMSATARTSVDGMRALVSAGSHHAQRERWSLSALDRAQTATQRADREPSELPWLWWINESWVTAQRGQCYVLLGQGEAGYELLDASLREHPKSLRRGSAEKHLGLARAAVAMGEVERACKHTRAARRIFTETSAVRFLDEIHQFRATELAPYADSRAVQRLDEQFQDEQPRQEPAGGQEPTAPRRKKPRGPRYVRTLPVRRPSRPSRGRWVLHKVDCPFAARANRVEPFPKGNRRSPAHLAKDPAVRREVSPCGHCLGALWS